jgi:4-amino-4-deoxy-L-arabinose transferase-like glycosyltransferase
LANQKDERRLDQFKTWHILIVILFIAFALRLILVFQPEVIHYDGMEYIRHAKETLAGNWTAGASGPVYPAFIAFAYVFTKNFELAGIWVSVIFGALLVIPVFYLGKEIFNERVGVVSGLVAAVHPFLYVPSGSVLTESTYHFFIVTSVLFGWFAFNRGRFYGVLLFSLFASLSFLTKPEAIGLLFIFSFWVLWFNPLKERRHWMRRIAMILAAVLAFLAFSAPYLVRIRAETGKWSISKKVDVTIGSLSEMKNMTSPDESPFRREGLPLLSLIKDPLSQLVRVGSGLLKSFYTFQRAFTPILSFFAVIGWVGIVRNRSLYSLKANFYILTYHFFFFGFVFSIFFISRRYTSHMISISIPWAAFGFYMFLEWVHRRWKFGKTPKKMLTILLILLLTVLFIQGMVIHTRENRAIRKEAGLWMKENLPRGVNIMSRSLQEAFYSELRWARFPEGSYEKVLGVARSKGIQYLVLDEDIEKDSPGFWGQIKEKDLILLKELKAENQRLAIFKIVY